MQDYATREVAKEQPCIYRLTRLGAAAVEKGHGLSFIDEVGKIIWGGVDGWNTGSHLADAAARAGLDLVVLGAAVASDPDRYERIIQENQRNHLAAGHWGVPTMVFEREPFFRPGPDRCPQVALAAARSAAAQLIREANRTRISLWTAHCTKTRANRPSVDQ